MKRRFGAYGRRLTAGLTLLVLLGASQASTAGAAPPSVAWQIDQSTLPTNLVPGSESAGNGPEYEIFITNVGGAAATGITVTDRLPIGFTTVGSAEPKIENRVRSAFAEAGSCSVALPVVTCDLPGTIAPGASFVVTIPLTVALNAGPLVSNEISVEGGGAAGSSVLESSISSTPAPFAILGSPSLSAVVSDEAGGVPSAGSEPFVTTFSIGVTKVGTGRPSQAMRKVGVQLPNGIAVNPLASTRRCLISELALNQAKSPNDTCPPESQVGQAYIVNNDLFSHGVLPVYNMVPPRGVVAELGLELAQTVVIIQGGLSGDFRLTATSNEIVSRFNVSEIAITLWGNPSDPRHDPGREGGKRSPGGCQLEFGGCSVPPSPVRLLSAPTSCTEPLEFSATVESWLGGLATGTSPFTDRTFAPVQNLAGCRDLRFSPSFASRATTNVSDSPSGLEFSIHQPQDQSVGGRSTAALKDVRVTLPDGMSLNPSAANGLDACTEAQMGYQPKGSKIRFATTPQSCPNAAKVGTLEASTPLLETKLPGAIYVAKPFDNPFGSLLAVYLAIEDEQTGIVTKLAGKVEPGSTGQLTARFSENPELPIEDIDVHFFKGDRAALVTPITCGPKTTTATLTPWSTPEGLDVDLKDSFSTSAPAISGPCPGTEAEAPKAFTFSAGTVNPLAGAYSPFVLRIARPDGTQHITGIDTTLPQGLIGKLAGIPYCPEAAIDLAKSREAPEKGKEELASPSCPAASDVGTVRVTAGAGSAPIAVSGHAYLAGPYKGARLSLVVVVPAIAGPFDLGTVVSRVALNIGEFDARIHAVSDPLPTIRAGIPVDVRSVEVKLDRSNFTLNPTSCEVAAIEGAATTQAGQSAPLKNRFQVGDCGRLGFKPSLKLTLSGKTKRSGHPALKAVVTYPKKGAYANIARAQVGLPHSEFLDQGNLNQVCKQADLKAGTCPKSTIYGRAKAWTPLLDKPLEGPVYLGVGFGYKLPALVADLNGQVRILLKGKVDTTKHEGLRNTFEAVPDAPVSRFVLEMKGGKKYGLLVNSENICKKPQRASVEFRAQNGKSLHLTPKIGNSCKGKKGKHRNKHRHGGKPKSGAGKRAAELDLRGLSW
jgi:uncharacterized repeat protein (TIGR01451 family)